MPNVTEAQASSASTISSTAQQDVDQFSAWHRRSLVTAIFDFRSLPRGNGQQN